MAVYEHEGLEKTPLYEVTGVDGLYNANGKKLKLMETDLRMDIQNITAIKDEIENQNDGSYDYLVLQNDGKHEIGRASCRERVEIAVDEGSYEREEEGDGGVSV